MIFAKNNFYFLNNVSKCSVPFCEHMHTKFAKNNDLTTEKYSQKFHNSEFYDDSKFEKMQNFMMIPNLFTWAQNMAKKSYKYMQKHCKKYRIGKSSKFV